MKQKHRRKPVKSWPAKQSWPRKQSWFARHPFIVIGIIVAAGLGPFVRQAIQTDDTLFVRTAEWIQQHPADFFGFKFNWWLSDTPMWVANLNPPLMSYYLAVIGTLFGWSETALHLGGCLAAFAAAAGIYSLAKMWCERPLLAAIIAIITPAFLVSATTLMCDVAMLSFWVWALVFWEQASRTEGGQWRYLAAGVLAGLALLTKYSAINLLPLLGVLGLFRVRQAGWWIAGLAIPVIMLAGYEWLTAKMYGHGLFLGAVHHSQAFRFGFTGGWFARVIIALAFAGGSTLPVLFLAPWLWPRRTFLAGAILVLGGLFGIFYLKRDLGLIHSWIGTEVLSYWSFRWQIILLTAGGLHLLALAGAALWQRRDAVTTVLALWIASAFVFAAWLNWTVNVRSFLPAVVAAAILAARRLKTTPAILPGKHSWLLPFVPATAVCLAVLIANYRLANVSRTTAREITAAFKPSGGTLWFEGHNGFQYYMEKLGAHPVDVERSTLSPGDIVVISWANGNNLTVPPGTLGAVAIYQPDLHSWMNIQSNNGRTAAGFYTSDWGPVPFALGNLPAQTCSVLKVHSQLQFNALPANPKEVAEGVVPSFPKITCHIHQDQPAPEDPEAARQLQLADRLAQEGKAEGAIQLYQAVLNGDSQNAKALNGLAWVLATASNPQQRNGPQAVQLATQAVTLTESRDPQFIGTLAAAHAAAGQFDQAMRFALLGHDLANVTGQSEVSARNLKMLTLFSAGKPVVAASHPQSGRQSPLIPPVAN